MLCLCSDGLIAHSDEAELASIVLEQSELDSACDLLEAVVNQRDGGGSINIIIARMGSGMIPLHGLWNHAICC